MIHFLVVFSCRGRKKQHHLIIIFAGFKTGGFSLFVCLDGMSEGQCSIASG